MTGLKSKEFQSSIDKVCRSIVYASATLGASMLASVAIAVGLISWEVATGSIPALIASFIGVEIVISKKTEKAEVKE